MPHLVDGSGVRVASVSRAMRVLEAFVGHPEGVALSRLAATLGYGKASLSKILGTLVREGFVRQDPPTGRFHLSWRLLKWKRPVGGSCRTNPSRTSVPRILERLALPYPSVAASRLSATPSGWPTNASSTRIARDTEATRTPEPSTRCGIGLETRFPI